MLLVTSTCAADDCTYDQVDQLEQLQTIAKSHPGGVLDKASNTIRWNSPSNTASSITYGGCDHLGFTVRKNIASARKLTEPDVLALATSLAKEYWAPSETNVFVAAIAAKSFSRESTEATTYFHVINEYYVEFYIEHNPLEGYVAIAWTRNF